MRTIPPPFLVAQNSMNFEGPENLLNRNFERFSRVYISPYTISNS
ncbi:hypothetical protein [Methanobacterium sp.]